MNYSVYILRSLKNGDLYVGSTEDISNRLARHNCGKVKSTKGYRPWEILDIMEFPTRSDAVKHEMFLQTGQQKGLLRAKYGVVVK